MKLPSSIVVRPTWLVVALCMLLALLVAACGPELPASPSQQSPVQTPTATITHPPPTPTPTPSVTPVPATPTLGAPTATPPPSDLDDFVFGEPQIVLTHTSAIGIAGWLPDSQRLLLTVQQPDTITESIETINVTNGQREVYAQRRFLPVLPLWLDTRRQVAFVDEPVNGLVPPRFDLAISGGPRQSVLLNVNQAIAGRDDWIVALPRGSSQPIILDGAGQVLRQAPLDLESLGFDPRNSSELRMAAHPSQPKVAMFNSGSFVIVDLETGEAQQIDLGQEEVREWGPRSAINATWSPDGEHLALITSVGPPTLPYSALGIVEVASGHYREIDLGQRFVSDISWAPDSRHLAALVVLDTGDGYSHGRLVLVDGATDSVREAPLQREFGGGSWGEQLAWSPDGRKIAANCPTIAEGRTCLISVARGR